MWGGLECTVNRVADIYVDQLELNGHAHRIDDLDRFAELGITAIRYPVLWERTAPVDLASADWSWPDERLGRLRELGIRPIIGLVHHGSGPKGTDLLDPAFPAMLARYAGTVAARYPWATDYTPVNEPLTTARFSALYGHWYPHRRNEAAFYRAVLTQCQAVVAAMRAIRSVNPHARLIQTEDLGEVFARPQMAEQAAHENARRWLSLDLLTGRVVPGHPLWDRLLVAGISEAELRRMAEDPCPPDVIGINHYLTSERLLDERLERYPEWSHGGNGEQSYADIEAVRVCAEGPGGWRRLLRATWERYKLPVAATEVHLGCSREEQLRWLAEVWSIARDLREDGAEIRAVTVWSLLGAFGWNRLVTQPGGDYEPGVFDLRAPKPRPTAIAGLVADLAAGKEPTHPVLAVPGWWRRPSRFLYPLVDATGTDVTVAEEPEIPEDAPGVLLIGPATALGDAFASRLAIRAIPFVHLDGEATSRWLPRTLQAITSKRPWAVVMTMTAADMSPEDAAAAAQACATEGIPMLFHLVPPVDPVSTDWTTPDNEHSRAELMNAWSDAAMAVEQAIGEAHPEALVVRSDLSLVPGADHAATLNGDEDGSHYVRDLIEGSLDLLIDGERGVWHLPNETSAIWHRVAPGDQDLAFVGAHDGMRDRQSAPGMPVHTVSRHV
jgi:dTDP-4-dehydrorhamnose reductase